MVSTGVALGRWGAQCGVDTLHAGERPSGPGRLDRMSSGALNGVRPGSADAIPVLLVERPRVLWLAGSLLVGDGPGVVGIRAGGRRSCSSRISCSAARTSCVTVGIRRSRRLSNQRRVIAAGEARRLRAWRSSAHSPLWGSGPSPGYVLAACLLDKRKRPTRRSRAAPPDPRVAARAGIPEAMTPSPVMIEKLLTGGRTG